MKALALIFVMLLAGNVAANSSAPRHACLAVVQDSTACRYHA